MSVAINPNEKLSVVAERGTNPDGPVRRFVADDFIDDRALAARLQISAKTPAQWRHLGKFSDVLPFYKFGRCVRYRREDVDSFIDMMRSGGTCMGDEK